MRSQLFNEVHPVPASPLLPKTFGTLSADESGWISLYKIINDENNGTPVKYDNLEYIKEENNEWYPDAITDPRQVDKFDESCVAEEFVVIGPSTIPVKFRVELPKPIKIPVGRVPSASRAPRVRRGAAQPIKDEYRPARMRYFNARLMVFNHESGAWNVSSLFWVAFFGRKRPRRSKGTFIANLTNWE